MSSVWCQSTQKSKTATDTTAMTGCPSTGAYGWLSFTLSSLVMTEHTLDYTCSTHLVIIPLWLASPCCWVFVQGLLPWPIWPATGQARKPVDSTSCPQHSAGSRRRRCGGMADLHSRSNNRAQQRHDGKKCSSNLVWLEAEWIQHYHRILWGRYTMWYRVHHI